MRSVVRALSCAAVLIPSVLAAAPGAEAASAAQISYVRYDSPGDDTGSNSSLNAEYVKITNKGSTNRSLTGWTLRDKTGYTYRFPTFTLKAGATVVVRTGKGTASSTYRLPITVPPHSCGSATGASPTTASSATMGAPPHRRSSRLSPVRTTITCVSQT